jgi:hypothetical protein
MEKYSTSSCSISLITILGIVYLSSVLTGKINKDKLGQTEVIILRRFYCSTQSWLIGWQSYSLAKKE